MMINPNMLGSLACLKKTIRRRYPTGWRIEMLRPSPGERDAIGIEKRKGHEGADHGHFSLRKVQDIRGL